MKQWAYGFTSDACDEYVRLAESTAMESLKKFVQVVRELYGNQYLRKPTREDIMKQMEINEKWVWPGMFGSLDCMHLDWKNCPTAWHGQFLNKDGN